jgi:hypothetical protein
MKKSKKSISQIRIEKEKINFVEQLKRTPIVQSVCERLGIGRATFYRWKADDPEFSKLVDEAFFDGHLLINDLAESQLVSAVKDRKMHAITYWLKHHHPDYSNRIEIKMQKEDKLTEEEQILLEEAIKKSKELLYGGDTEEQ